MRMLASIPSWKRLPCAARPTVSTSIHWYPLWARHTASPVGSVTTAPSVRVWFTRSAVPRLPYSSSATAATTTSPRSWAPWSTRAFTAAMPAATLPFMSKEPRP